MNFELVFQMSALFSKSYLDWKSKVSDDGWSVLTIATHSSQPTPSVLGPDEEMRGALWIVFDGLEFNHVDQVCLFGIIVVCYFVVFVFLNCLFQDDSHILGKEGLFTSPDQVLFLIICFFFHFCLSFRSWRW